MKYFLTILFSLSLAACASTGSISGSKQTDGAVIGGIIGGIAGNQVGKGSGRTAAIIGGTLLGAVIGSSIGQQLDERDRMLAERNAQQALEYSKDHSQQSWSNPNTGHSGTTKPTETYYTSAGTPCREYVSTVKIGGKSEQMYGTACRQADGSWKAQ